MSDCEELVGDSQEMMWLVLGGYPFTCQP